MPGGRSARPFNGFLVDGSRWREHLLAFIRTPENWERTKARLLEPCVGMVADRWVIAREQGVRYVAGTMFAAKPEVMRSFQAETYSVDRFAAADDSHMGSFAHDCERAFGRAVRAQGFRLVEFGHGEMAFQAMRLILGIWSFLFRMKRTSDGGLIVKVLKIPVYKRSREGVFTTTRKAYDLAVSLGGACACSKSLRKAKLQFASFPFDWLNGATFRDRVGLLTSGLAGWLSEGVEKIPEPPLCVGESHWRDRKYGFGLLHDFDRLTPMEVALPGVKAKYARRAEHLLGLIDRAKKVLLVWTDVPTSPAVTDDDLSDMLSTLRAKWPEVAFDVLVFRRQPDVPIDRMSDVKRGPIRIVTFDYMIHEMSKYGVLLADDDQLGKWLATQYEVADYRTPEEIARWKRISRQNRYREFGGHGPMSHLVGKLQYKVYKHLMKKLQRKGIAT